MRRLIALLLVAVFAGLVASCDAGGPVPNSQATPAPQHEAEPTEAVNARATQTALVSRVRSTVIASQRRTAEAERTEIVAAYYATQVVRDATATAHVQALIDQTQATSEPAPTVEPTATTAPPPPPPPDVLTFEGKSARKTEPFTLVGGTYKVDYKLTTSDLTCFTAGVTLQSVNEAGPNVFTGERITTDSVDEGETLEQTTYIYGVKPGTYYIDANTSCSWAITITRQ